jgi:hypothetical protein
MRHDCLITSRLAGPCATCRQAAWPAHVRGLLIYCEACCGCGRAGPEAAGTDAAPGGRTIRPGPRNAPETRYRARYCAGNRGETPEPPRPFPAFLGALSSPARGILRGDLRGDAARGLPPGPRLGRPPLACPPGTTTWPGRTRCHAARPWPPWPRCRPGRPGRPGHDAALAALAGLATMPPAPAGPHALQAPQARARRNFPPQSAAKTFVRQNVMALIPPTTGGLHERH